MARNLDLDKLVPPDEVLTVTCGGDVCKVTKLPVWTVFELRRLDEDTPAELQRIREIIETAVPDLSVEWLDAMDAKQYSALVWYLINGEPPPEAKTSDPTTPAPPDTPAST